MSFYLKLVGRGVNFNFHVLTIFENHRHQAVHICSILPQVDVAAPKFHNWVKKKLTICFVINTRIFVPVILISMVECCSIHLHGLRVHCPPPQLEQLASLLIIDEYNISQLELPGQFFVQSHYVFSKPKLEVKYNQQPISNHTSWSIVSFSMHFVQSHPGTYNYTRFFVLAVVLLEPIQNYFQWPDPFSLHQFERSDPSV